MSGYRQQDFLRAAADQKAVLLKELEYMDTLERDHAQRIGELSAQLASASNEVCTVLLPALDRPSIDRAVRLTGYVSLANAKLLDKREAHRVEIQDELASIEANPDYRDRELRRAPRVGTLVRKLEELEDFRKEPATIVSLAAHPRLDRLLDAGYGEDVYDGSWWRMRYYADWKAADEILERFPGKTFAQLRADVITGRETLAVYDPQIDSLRHEIIAEEQLEARHVTLTHALATLDERHLVEARAQLGRYLEDLDVADIADRLTAEADLELMFKRLQGTLAKRRYLQTMFDEQVATPRTQLRAQVRKLEQDVYKWQRPKMAYQTIAADKFEKRFVDRRPKYQKHWAGYSRSYSTVYVFNDYGRMNYASDFLWWDVMTDGRLDGNFIPEVAEYRRSHPHVRYTPTHDSAFDDAATASLTADADSSGSPLGLVDAS